MENLKLNGIEVNRVGVSIFVPLPRELSRTCGGCCCGKCDGVGYWDTLAVATEPQGMGRDTTWTVHYPELHQRDYAELRAKKGVAA